MLIYTKNVYLKKNHEFFQLKQTATFFKMFILNLVIRLQFMSLNLSRFRDDSFIFWEMNAKIW